MNKIKNYGINVGSSSILLIFVILCLVSFASLSIVSANADYKLSQKIAKRTTAYYNAYSQAEISLKKVNDSLVTLYKTADSEKSYYAKAGHTISFAFPVTDVQSLSITIELLYPSSANGPFYNITQWQTENIETPIDGDTTLKVIQ